MIRPESGLRREHRGASAMASENVVEFTDENFETEVLKSSQPVLVDFWAEWCMPCRMLAPTIDKLADSYAGKVKVGKLDTDSNREVAMKYGISAIPTVILFKDGEVAQKFVGLKQEREFKEALDTAASPR
jgi:thioredoxin 1